MPRARGCELKEALQDPWIRPSNRPVAHRRTMRLGKRRRSPLAQRELGPESSGDLAPGWRLRVPGYHKVIYLPSTYFFLDYTADAQDPLEIRTKDNNNVIVDVTVPVRIKPGHAYQVVQTGNHIKDGGRYRYQRLAEQTTVETALVATGLLLASRHFIGFAVTPLGGWIGDRFGAERAQQGFGVLTVFGFALVAAGWPIGGALAIVGARAALSALGPVAVARRHGPGAMMALSRQATWLDFGAAVGPLVTGALLQAASLPQLYAAAAVIVLAALVWLMWQGATRSG